VVMGRAANSTRMCPLDGVCGVHECEGWRPAGSALTCTHIRVILRACVRACAQATGAPILCSPFMISTGRPSRFCSTGSSVCVSPVLCCVYLYSPISTRTHILNIRITIFLVVPAVLDGWIKRTGYSGYNVPGF